jgi:DNA-directed RNA polymerase subunit RPC12/RpoP
MDPILISCPECKKQIKAPGDSVGKKIRCKACEHTFIIKSPPKGSRGPAGKSSAPAKPAKTASPPKPAKPSKPISEDDEDDGRAYDLTGFDEKPRCPQCASAFEDGAVVCLECGYNTTTREQGRTRKVRDVTGGDKFLWLLPGFVCVLTVILLLGYCFFHHFALPPMLIDKWDEDVEKGKTRTEIITGDNAEWWHTAIFHPAGELWLFVGAIWASWKAGRFAVNRLILHPDPPEIEEK